MINIPDAPWIRETERTGRCSAQNGAWWNTPSEEEDEFFEEEEEDDVFYGNETADF